MDVGVVKKTMNPPALVSIIIPTLNCAATLERSLLSVKAQTYPHIEIIVVDNHSSDETVKIASRYARVLQAGPERSAQFNLGAREANGAYLYRIDGDFELAPGVVAACVEAVEQGGFDAVALVNRSSGDGFWAHVRRLERDTYRNDALIVAARFWKSDAFNAVGGFDESLVACEDYDLHNRLALQGCKIGRVDAEETHLGEPGSLWAYAEQSFYYGPSVLRYLRKHPRRGVAQMIPLRPSYVRHWRSLVRQPKLLLGLVVLKTVQYASAAAGILVDWLGLRENFGRLASRGLLALVLVLLALLGLFSALPGFGLPANVLDGLLCFGGGLSLWQLAGRRRAHLKQKPLFRTLPEAAFAFAPLLLLLVVGPYGGENVSTQTWMLLSIWMGSLSIGSLVYLLEPLSDPQLKWRGVPYLLAAVAALFVLWAGYRLLTLLNTYSLSAYDLAVYDQGLWNSVHNLSAGGAWLRLMYTSIEGQSFFAQTAAPILFLFMPFYALGLCGPGLLLVSQAFAIGLGALALYRLACAELGRWPAALLAAAFLVYYVTLHIGIGNFQVMAFAIPLLLFMLDACRRGRYGLFYGLLFLTLACGVDASLAVAGLGLYLVLFSKSRRQGFVALTAGLLWTWVAVSAFEPFFGGTVGQELAPYGPSQNVSLTSHILTHIFRPQVAQYLGQLLSPLGFIPLLDAPALIPALPRLLFNFLGDSPRYLSHNGWYEFTILPFLFVAIASGLGKVSRYARQRGWAPPEFAGSLFVLCSCLITTLFLAPGLLIINLSGLTAHQRLGAQIMAQVPTSASLAVQDPFAVIMAHRRQLTVLPEVAEADFVLFDVYHPDRGPEPGTYNDLLQVALQNPDYGLRSAENGYLLFERGADARDKLNKLGLVTSPTIQYPHPVELADSAVYLGFDLSTAAPRPGETVYITHYWKCLQPLPKPYLLFLGYPGGRLFDEFGFGLLSPDLWQPGEIVRQEQQITLPQLPDGDQYEIVVGLWYDSLAPQLSSPQQLLGGDIIHIASVVVQHGDYTILPWAAASSPGATP